MKYKYKDVDEIKLLKKSKLYIDAMSQSINPLTGEYINDSILQEQKLQKCLEYVSYILNEIIEKGGLKNISRKRRGLFMMTREEMDNINYTDEFIGIKAIAERINSVIDLSRSSKITGNKLANMMYELGYLSLVEGSRRKCINAKSTEIGLKYKEITLLNGEKYKQIVYGNKAQRFVVEKLFESELNYKG